MSAGRKLIVAIDGPSGAGKSTLSKALARALNYINIDTGAMYRSVALMIQRKAIDLEDSAAIKGLCNMINLEFVREGEQERVLVNDEDVSSAIRTPEISLLTAQVAAIPAVRSALVALQRRMGQQGGVVLEGRDIGTVVFPAAEVKFFLSASAVERGRRRYEELCAKGIQVNLQQTINDVEERDRVDSEREHSPLMQAEDAVVIDSTQLSIDQVLEQMIATVRERESLI